MRCWMRLDWILGGCALNDIWRCWKREGGMLRARIIWKKTKRWSNQKNTEDREGGGWSITHLFVCWKVGGNESERDFPIDSVPLLCCSSEGIFRNAIWLNISYITEVLNWIKRRRGQWVELRDRIDWPPEREREREKCVVAEAVASWHQQSTANDRSQWMRCNWIDILLFRGDCLDLTAARSILRRVALSFSLLRHLSRFRLHFQHNRTRTSAEPPPFDLTCFKLNTFTLAYWLFFYFFFFFFFSLSLFLSLFAVQSLMESFNLYTQPSPE